MSETLLTLHQLIVRFPGSSQPFNAHPWNCSFIDSLLVGLVGANGSGKTTFFRALLGELDCLQGKINFGSIGPCSFAYLPQETDWDPYQTVQKHLELAFFPKRGLFQKLSSEDYQKCFDTAEELQIKKFLSVPLGELSSGLRQRAFLGRTLLQDATVYLLDEPTNHLDAEMQDVFWMLVKVLSKKKLILVTSHDPGRVKRFCDVILKMENQCLTEKQSGAIPEESFQE